MIPLVPTRRRGAWCYPGRFLSRASLAACLALTFATALVAIWLRNRDILRDLYDYSSVILSAGRVEQGLKPYVDIRTPMQSATFLLNWGVESVFGHDYLALTWGGLVVSLGGGAALTWLLHRRFSWAVALVLGGTVAVAGLAQHVVVFYNPIGLLCLALVAWGAANEPRLWRLRSPETWLVWGALLLGGINKINFHGLAVALAGVCVLRAGLAREVGARATLGSLAVLALVGLAAPLGFELAWTGATLRQWYENVLVVPGERYEFAARLLDPAVYLRPAHDLHHHVPFKPFTACGVAVVFGAALLAWRARRAAGGMRAAEVALLALGALGAAAGGVLLTLTNVESIALTSLGFVVGAGALWTAFAPRDATPRFVPAAALVWLGLGGWAAWHGSRVLYGPSAPNRAEYVRLESELPAFRYLRGVRLDPGLHQSLVRLEGVLRETPPDSTEVFFGPATEWLERAFPRSVIRGMPVWYHSGTALSPEDGPWLITALEQRGVQRLVWNHNWESWPPEFAEHVRTHFAAERLGPSATVYTRLSAVELAARQARPVRPVVAHPTPAHFRGATGSNVFLRGTRFASDMTLFGSPWGEFFGRAGASRWEWNFGVYRLRGACALTLDAGATEPIDARMRIYQRGDAGRELVWERTASVAPDRPNVVADFELSPGGRALEFEIEVPQAANGRVAAGWRGLQISHSGGLELSPPLPFSPDLVRAETPQPARADAAGDALDFGEADAPAAATASTANATQPPREVGTAPALAIVERWLKRESAGSNFTASVDVEKMALGMNVEPVVLALAWYKSGRLEILTERTIDPNRETKVELAGWMPEPQGWVGVISRPANPNGPARTVRLGDLSIR